MLRFKSWTGPLGLISAESQSRLSNPRDSASLPGTSSTSLLHALGGLLLSAEPWPLCLLLHSSLPPQPQEPAAAPGPSQPLPCQALGQLQGGNLHPYKFILYHPVCGGGQAPSQPNIPQLPPSHSSASIPAPTAPALIFLLLSSAHFAPSRRMFKATPELQALCFSHLCPAWASSPISIHMQGCHFQRRFEGEKKGERASGPQFPDNSNQWTRLHFHPSSHCIMISTSLLHWSTTCRVNHSFH